MKGLFELLAIFLAIGLVLIDVKSYDNTQCATDLFGKLCHIGIPFVGYLLFGNYLIAPFRKFSKGSYFDGDCVNGDHGCGCNGHSNSMKI